MRCVLLSLQKLFFTVTKEINLKSHFQKKHFLAANSFNNYLESKTPNLTLLQSLLFPRFRVCLCWVSGHDRYIQLFQQHLRELHGECLCHRSELNWFISLRHLSVAHAPFLSTKLQFGMTAITHNPHRQMTREYKSCHIDSEIETES